MKIKRTHCLFRSLALGAAAAALGSYVAVATPYATCLTNTGSAIWFRLNEAAGNVKIISAGDTVTNDLGAVAAGLTNVPLSISGTYRIVCSKTGSGIYQIGSSVAYNSPRGVAVNGNPADPNFGRVYIANSAAAAKAQGIYVHYADTSLVFPSVRTAGWTMSTGGSAPYQINVGTNGVLYLTDWSDASGNLVVTDPDVTSFQYVLKKLTVNPDTGVIGDVPVGLGNNHGSVQAVFAQGTLADGNLKLYVIDEDYQTDPTNPSKTQMNSLWRYDVGAGPLPYEGVPTKILTPPIAYASQGYNTVSVGPNGYIYYNQRRENAGGPPGTGVWSPSVMIVDPNLYIDQSQWAALYDPTNLPWVPNPDLGGLYTATSNYWRHSSLGGFIWESQSASTEVGSNGADYLLATAAISVSPDGNWLACITYYNTLFMVPLTNGIPDMSKRLSLALGGSAAGRGIAWDAANNFYLTSSGLGQMRYYSLGLTGSATTSSDGHFDLKVASAKVSVSTLVSVAKEQGPVSGTITISRTGDGNIGALPVNFTLGGTAARDADYVLKVGGSPVVGNTVTIPAGSSFVNVEVAPIDDSIPEPTETVIFTIAGGYTYNVDLFGVTATVAIVDNETPFLFLSAVSPSFFEGMTNDYIRATFTRYGDTNAAVTVNSANLIRGGAAVENVDYYVENLPLTMDFGQITTNVALLYPIDNALLQGDKTITLQLAAGSGYTVSNQVYSVTLIDDELPAETVLWSDDFDLDTSANYAIKFGATNVDMQDYTAQFLFDYAWDSYPPAPHSAGTTLGLKLRVNKDDTVPSAAGVNLYPIGKSFSGNYALRFDMVLQVNSISGSTEFAIFGINHSGNRTNWFRGTSPGVPAGTVYDGLWFQVETDASASGDYVLNTAPAVTTGGIVGPTAVGARSASSLTSVFKAPPFAYAGSPSVLSPNFNYTWNQPAWVQVEISQIGRLITLSLNKTPIITYSNATAFTSGAIMLGADDAYDSIGNGAAGLGDGAVYYDNVRVVQLQPVAISSITTAGSTVTINFKSDLAVASSKYQVATSSNAALPADQWSAAAATVTQTGLNTFKAVTTANGNQQFYRIRIAGQ